TSCAPPVGPSTSPAPPAAEVAAAIEPRAASNDGDSPASAPLPSPAAGESRIVAMHYSATPTPSEALQGDSATVDNPTPDPPSDPQPPSNPPPPPNPPAAPYDATAP